MSDPRTSHDVASESKDSWDLVFEQLAGRRLFKLGLAILALLYALAIYAPLIASDRPYVLEAVDYQAYDQARRGLVPVSLGLNGLLRQTPEQYVANRVEGSTQTYDQALQAELVAFEGRLEALTSRLAPSEEEALADLRRLSDLAEGALGAAATDEATALGAELASTARDLRDRLTPRRAPDEDGRELQGQRTYPLFESISGFEVFFMVLWAFVLSWPLWNRLVNRRLLAGSRLRVRQWRVRKLAAVLLVSAFAGVLWHAVVGGQLAFHVAPYKRALTDGEIVATHAVFPPLAYGFAETNLDELYRPPSWTSESAASQVVRFAEPASDSAFRHVLGTDSLGRDLLVRAVWGGRVSLSVGLVSTAILMVIGILVGSLAGYFGGRVDLVVSRVIEVVLCFPVFFLILVVVAFVGPSVLNIMLVIGALRWTGVARLCRAELLRLKELDFVVAARAQGLSTRRILLRHLLPNAMGPLIVAGTFAVAAGILIESSLSFLGFGIQLPIPSWGALVNDSREAAHWWIQLFPGLLIFVTVVCYNLVGDAIRDAMDPKRKG